MAKKRILLGMSGGTDSSVSAMLLQDMNFEVVGVTFRLWSESDDFNNSEEPSYIKEARLLAEKLEIEHSVIDVKDFFYKEIISYFKEEYMAGRTPNPCAKCNVILKWRLLIESANRQNCAYVSTGHYANIEQNNGKFYITKGVDPEKEQSFFLWGLSQEILSRAVLPLGKLTKNEVKEIASKKGFTKVANKKESIGVCFINDGNYQPFLSKLLEQEKTLPGEGDFVDEKGHFIGKHKGYPFYTVGQRRGLGLSPNEPWYVTHINAANNKITLGKRNDLYQEQMLVRDYYFHDLNELKGTIITRIRYRKQSAESTIEIIDDKTLKVNFVDKEWSIAPGQTAAFYIGNRLIGGGFIVS